MSLMAYWCGNTWGVSRNEVKALQELATAYELDTFNSTYGATLKAQSITFKTTYRIETGTKDIDWVIKRWKDYLGFAGPLYVGMKQFGSKYMQLTKIAVSDTILDDFGRIRQATVSITLAETSDDYIVSVVDSTDSSAALLSASAQDKAMYKTYSI